MSVWPHVSACSFSVGLGLGEDQCVSVSVWVSVGLFLCALCVSPLVCVISLSVGGQGGVCG